MRITVYDNVCDRNGTAFLVLIPETHAEELQIEELQARLKEKSIDADLFCVNEENGVRGLRIVTCDMTDLLRKHLGYKKS
jgi:hypothetical protein